MKGRTKSGGVNMDSITNKPIYISVAGWIDMSCDDGPGIRSVLFFQGCSKHCPGCHNALTHDPKLGKEYEISQLVNMIESNCLSRMITISGGEPLEQREGLKKLLEELKLREFNICLYTGTSLEDVPDWVLEQVDYIKVGKFVEQLRHGDLQYYGSSNQKLYMISNGRVLSEVA